MKPFLYFILNSIEFAAKGPIDNKSATVHIMTFPWTNNHLFRQRHGVS